MDATFDHIAPLAIPRMPAFLSSVVTAAVEDNVNLDVSGQLARFDGPVRLIRRVKDEMISTDDNDVAGSNRGNQLLFSMLKNRYPKLVEQEEAAARLNEYMRTDIKGQGRL